MKKLGNAGLLGINKPVEYGGLGLDYKYQGKGYMEWVDDVFNFAPKVQELLRVYMYVYTQRQIGSKWVSVWNAGNTGRQCIFD